MSDEKVLIMGPTVKDVIAFARRNAVELGITDVDQVVAVTDERHIVGRRGQRLIALPGYDRAPRYYELIYAARAYGLEIAYR